MVYDQLLFDYLLLLLADAVWKEPATAKVESARRAELLALWRLY
jgi:hypothetical protein